jgi:serine/threonine-protein kinase
MVHLPSVTSLARVGTVVAGKYKLLDRLGGGGMGEVYRAEHQYAGRVVALKLLRKDFATDPDLTRRFFQEAQAVNKIRHPNIVDVLDAGLCEEGPYVVMEILEGASLSTALARAGRFDLTAALAVVLPMLSALEAAHRQGIVHRDLKPENVYLARTDAGAVVVKLVDFGIAKILGSSTNTNTGVVFGTPDYLSPEQASGEGVIDGRSDLFAVGIVLFELLTGKRPFEAPTAVATAYRIVHAAAPRLVALGVTAPARIQEVLDIALAKSQESRFPSAQTFIDMLAPVAPDGAVRRAALLALIDAVTGMAPTMDARQVGASLPAGEASAIESAAPRATPEPSGPPAAHRAVASGAPIAPTLASNREELARAYVTAAPDAREKSSPGLREPVPTAFGDPVAASSRSRPATATPTPLPVRQASSPNISTAQPRVSSRASPVPPVPRTSSVRRVAWTPRQLPTRVRGKCHVRGSVARAANRWIERAFGGARYEELLAALPAELAEMYRADAFNALVWYDLEALDTLLEAATAIVLGGDVATWRILAREHFERDLGPIFRGTTVRAGDPVSVLKRTVPAWSRLYDFANVRVTEASTSGAGSLKRVSLRFDGFDAASLALRHVTLGTADGLVRSAGQTELVARVTLGETSFTRDFEVELAWPPRA